MDVRFFVIFKLYFYTINTIFEFRYKSIEQLNGWTDNKCNDYSTKIDTSITVLATVKLFPVSDFYQKIYF